MSVAERKKISSSSFRTVDCVLLVDGIGHPIDGGDVAGTGWSHHLKDYLLLYDKARSESRTQRRGLEPAILAQSRISTFQSTKTEMIEI